MKNPNLNKQLQAMSSMLPHGAKAKITKAIRGEKYANVQTAFRGLAGEKLTKKVFTQAKKYFNAEELESIASQALSSN